MIRIAVIEDDMTIRKMVCEKVREYTDTNSVVVIDDFESAEAFLPNLESNERYHIVFSDIEMPGMDGLNLGLRLKRKWPNAYLVYLTNHSKFATKSYYVEAYQYILKNELDKRLPKIMGRLIEKVERDLKKFIVVDCAFEPKKLHYSDIICIRKTKGSKYVEYCTINECIRERTPLGNVLERLDSPEFIEIARGCIVNMRHIESIQDKIITLSNKKEVTASRPRIVKVKEQISRYWGNL